MRAHYALLAICVFVCLPGVASAQSADTTPPTIAALVPTPSEIWPANHKLVPVQIDTLVVDDTDPSPSVHIINVTSDDPLFVAEDVQITGDLSLNVRAVKTGKTGRVYTVYVQASDASGNTSLGVTTIHIGHTSGHDAPF